MAVTGPVARLPPPPLERLHPLEVLRANDWIGVEEQRGISDLDQNPGNTDTIKVDYFRIDDVFSSISYLRIPRSDVEKKCRPL